ncbi:DUF4159 domain-containing protein [Pacificimonas sp. ICDLI1SI03]
MGGLSFAAPFLLAALVALPALWFILRQSPPAPARVRLPSLKLLDPEDIPPPQAARPPWWLLLLRLLIVALLIGALAGPRWQARILDDAPARLTIIIDNGWAAATRWPEMREAAQDRIAELQGSGTRFAITPTAATAEPPGDNVRFMDGGTAQSALDALEPMPWDLDRAAAARRIPAGSDMLWIADGVADEGSDEMRARIAGAEIATFPSPEPVIRVAGRTASGWAVQVVRPSEDIERARVDVVAENGETLASDLALFDSEATSVRLNVPPARRDSVSRLRVGRGPASLFLADGSGARPQVVIVDPGGNAPPLESGSFYLRRALDPHAKIISASLADAAEAEANMFFLPDVGISGTAAEPLLDRVEKGAVAISFAGPRLAENGSALSPVALRSGARALGGVMSWQEPQQVADFSEGTPLAGLPTPEDATIAKQLLARGVDDEVQAWATLADGTPLVSARRHGAGLLILVHTSADPGWSDLPLSGLFEAMLVRMLPLAGNPAAIDIAAQEPWRLERGLSAAGTLAPAPSPATIEADAWEEAVAGPETPPGIWRSGDVRRALNLTSLIGPRYTFEPLATEGLRPASKAVPPVELGRWLLLAAGLLFAVDILVALALRGNLRRFTVGAPTATAAVAVMATLFLASPGHAQAEEQGKLQLAYVGGTSADTEIARGLESLSLALRRRTSVDPGPVARVDPAAEGIGRYPLVYWPAASKPRMSAAEAANLRGYLARGGMILFDFGAPLGSGSGARALLSPLGLPSLQQADDEHVLFRSYYLLREAGGGALWVESGTDGQSGRVSGTLIGGGDWAALWAGTAGASPSQRESALRFGINAVMYALTGTYKADQVHTKTLLGRIGE